MDLRPYARNGPKLSDYLPWAALIAPGVVLNKDGAFQRTLAFRGPDLDSATLSELMGQASRLNNALRRFGSGWCLHVEARRCASPGYPDSDFAHGLAWLIDEERRAVFESAGARFESDYFLTLAFLPPPERQGKLEGMLFEGGAHAPAQDYRAQLKRFQGESDQLLALFETLMPSAAWLSDALIGRPRGSPPGPRKRTRDCCRSDRILNRLSTCACGMVNVSLQPGDVRWDW